MARPRRRTVFGEPVEALTAAFRRVELGEPVDGHVPFCVDASSGRRAAMGMLVRRWAERVRREQLRRAA